MSDLGPRTRRLYWLPVEQRTELCDLAERELRWSPRSRSVPVFWNGKRWRAERTSFRIKVYTDDGQPVCARWHG